MEPGLVIHTVGSSVLEGKRSEKACCAWHVAGRGWAELGPGSPGAASAQGLTLVLPNVIMWLLSQQAQSRRLAPGHSGPVQDHAGHLPSYYVSLNCLTPGCRPSGHILCHLLVSAGPHMQISRKFKNYFDEV